MDYVVFGIGFGASILVMGLLLRDLGPRLRYRNPGGDDAVLPADLLVARVAWNRFCNALGAVLAIAGGLFVLATFVCILFMVSDDTGGWVMLGGLALFFLLMLYWTWAFFDRFGSYGILPERPAETTPEPAPDAPVEDAGDVDTQAVGDQVVVGPDPAELRDDDASVPDADEREEPVLTPEERLAAAETPVDHGSAAGDLDSPGGGHHRLVPVRADQHEEPSDGPDHAEAGGQQEPEQDEAVEPQLQIEGESIESPDSDIEGRAGNSEIVDNAEKRRDSGEN